MGRKAGDWYEGVSYALHEYRAHASEVAALAGKKVPFRLSRVRGESRDCEKAEAEWEPFDVTPLQFIAMRDGELLRFRNTSGVLVHGEDTIYRDVMVQICSNARIRIVVVEPGLPALLTEDDFREQDWAGITFENMDDYEDIPFDDSLKGVDTELE